MPAAQRLVAPVERWFARNQRPLPWRANYEPYLVWVSEVMLQQTRMEVVLRYFERFIERFPNVSALARASEHDVLTAWSGLGYYRRARMLREGAIDVVDRFNGMLPESIEDLMTIPGIGRYTAGAIASIAYDRAAPIVDGNVARVLSRLMAIDEPVGSPRLMRGAWLESQRLVRAAVSPRLLNQGLMELGALICRPQKPDCAACPVISSCAAFRTGRTDSLPAPKLAKAPRALTIPLYFIEGDDGRVLMRHERGALMTSLLHLPHGTNDLLAGTLLSVIEKGLIGTFRHTITTRRIDFQLVAAELRDTIRDGAPDYVWVDPAELCNIPHPSYVAKAMTLAARLQSTQCAGG